MIRSSPGLCKRFSTVPRRMVLIIVPISGIDFVQSVDVKKCKNSIDQVQKQLQGFYKQCALLRPILEVDSVCSFLSPSLYSCSASETSFCCFKSSYL